MKKPVLIVAGIAALAIALALAWRSQRVLETGLPPRKEFPSLAEAEAAAQAYAKAHGGNIVAVLGTGSQAPYIPPAPAGRDPLTTVVAYVVMQPAATFQDISPGALCIYFPRWNNARATMHQAAAFSAGGWIMSGLHNERSEFWERMTPANFGGLVAHAFVVTP